MNYFRTVVCLRYIGNPIREEGVVGLWCPGWGQQPMLRAVASLPAHVQEGVLAAKGKEVWWFAMVSLGALRAEDLDFKTWEAEQQRVPNWDELIPRTKVDDCPKCGGAVVAKGMRDGGGVECSVEGCSYWYCV